MAMTPKSGRRKGIMRETAPALSAVEALQAAESAVGSGSQVMPPAELPAAKKSKLHSGVDPLAIIAATTATDAAPEPVAPPQVEAPPAAAVPLAEKGAVQIDEPDSLSPPGGTVETLTPPAIEGTKMMNDVIETGKKFAEETKAKLESAYADLNQKAKVGVEKSAKAVEELSDITKGNVEAMVESGKIAAKGLETLGQEAVDYGRKSFEKATASIRSFSTVKTPTEFFQLQSQLFSSSFDELTKEAAKSSEALIKLAGEVAQPITARVTLVTDKVKSFSA